MSSTSEHLVLDKHLVRAISRRLVEMHREFGGGVLSLHDPSLQPVGGTPIPLSEYMLTVEGRELLAGKHVRGLLFKVPAEVKEDERTVVFSAYDEDVDKSYVLVGRVA